MKLALSYYNNGRLRLEVDGKVISEMNHSEKIYMGWFVAKLDKMEIVRNLEDNWIIKIHSCSSEYVICQYIGQEGIRWRYVGVSGYEFTRTVNFGGKVQQIAKCRYWPQVISNLIWTNAIQNNKKLR